MNRVYTIKITEINTGEFEIEAGSRAEAVKKFQEDYFQHANDYLLEPEDTSFTVEDIRWAD